MSGLPSRGEYIGSDTIGVTGGTEAAQRVTTLSDKQQGLQEHKQSTTARNHKEQHKHTYTVETQARTREDRHREPTKTKNTLTDGEMYTETHNTPHWTLLLIRGNKTELDLRNLKDTGTLEEETKQTRIALKWELISTHHKDTSPSHNCTDDRNQSE